MSRSGAAYLRSATDAALTALDVGTARFGGRPWFDVTFFGAVGDGVTDDTAAVQAAIAAAKAAGGGIVFFPAGIYLVTTLVVDAVGLSFMGAGRLATKLRTVSGDLLDFGPTITPTKFCCTHMALQSRVGGGHVFNVKRGLSHGLFFDVDLQQQNNGKSVWFQDDAIFGYIDNLWMHVDVEHTAGATVATWHLRSPAANRNKWIDVRPTFSGNYVWLIETTSAGSYANDNTIEGITSEVNNGGLVKLKGCRGTRLADIGIYDLGTTTRDLIRLEDADTGLITSGVRIENVRRHGGTLGAGLFDVSVNGAAATPAVDIVRCGGATSLQVDANSKRITVYGSEGVTVTDDASVLYVSAAAGIAGMRTGSAGAGSTYSTDATIKGVLDHDGATVGLYGKTPTAQAAAIANAAGGAIIDVEARAALNALLLAVRNLGAIAT